MNLYRVRYDAEGNIGFSYETLQARGIMHAFKLASDHMKEIRKLTGNNSIVVGSIKQEKKTNAQE